MLRVWISAGFAVYGEREGDEEKEQERKRRVDDAAKEAVYAHSIE